MKQGGGAAPSPARTILTLAAVCGAGLIAAVSLYRGYACLFPFRFGADGVCLYCGSKTALGPGGWADFCPRHEAFLGILPAVMVAGEALSLAAVAISLWLVVRAAAYRLGRRASLVIVLVSLAAVLSLLLVRGGGGRMMQQFLFALFAMLFVLTAIYVDSIESLFIMTAVALGIAGLVAFLIKMISWVIVGYMAIF